MNCKHLSVKKYNPFKFDNFSDDMSDCDENIQKISQILESCKSYSVNDINNLHHESFDKFTSMFFLNIDGNKSNFDSLVAELERYTHKFSIVGIAETNTDADVGQVYQMAEYTSFYQNVQPGKLKGTGVAYGYTPCHGCRAGWGACLRGRAMGAPFSVGDVILMNFET